VTPYFLDLIAFHEISNDIINTFWLQINRHNDFDKMESSL
jgi:hypothetical protein